MFWDKELGGKVRAGKRGVVGEGEEKNLFFIFCISI